MLAVCVGENMASTPTTEPGIATVEEVAAWLSFQEGWPVSAEEVRRVEALTLRKLRAEFRRRGLTVKDLASS